ncbi:hypothetical protein RHMOL_Rhmol07G0321300 [Rhododendron molle]|uniref:Uncharacterized protein n=1 Tax=Rhododendron molle TaxID=49168 RepID=A0ACC0N854_RHOML|nr:hypothetical protein RHMOL_Rhmol07G0321300 [Rhododendron molle]
MRRRFPVPGGHGHVVLCSNLGCPNLFWSVQICLGLRGYFGNFTLKNYPNKFGPSKIRLDGQDARTAPRGLCPPGIEKFLNYEIWNEK